MRLIDADELLSRMRERCDSCPHNGNREYCLNLCEWREAIDEADDMPEIEMNLSAGVHHCARDDGQTTGGLRGMTRDEFMTKAKDEIDRAFSGQKNRMMNLVEQAWAEGKRNAELDEITDIVKKALDRAQPSYPVTPNYPDPVSPCINPIITCNTEDGKPPEAHFDNGAEMPHQTSIVICTSCGQKWAAVRPLETQNAELECPKCHRRGTAVETGLPLDPGVSGDESNRP